MGGATTASDVEVGCTTGGVEVGGGGFEVVGGFGVGSTGGLEVGCTTGGIVEVCC